MQNTITSRRLSYNLIALILLLVAVATLVGFAAGLAVSNPPSASVSPLLVQSQAPTSGWAYHYDSLKNKWYAQHFAMTPTGLVIDEFYELQNRPE